MLFNVSMETCISISSVVSDKALLKLGRAETKLNFWARLLLIVRVQVGHISLAVSLWGKSTCLVSFDKRLKSVHFILLFSGQIMGRHLRGVLLLLIAHLFNNSFINFIKFQSELFRADEGPIDSLNNLLWRWRSAQDRVNLFPNRLLTDGQSRLDLREFIWAFNGGSQCFELTHWAVCQNGCSWLLLLLLHSSHKTWKNHSWLAELLLLFFFVLLLMMLGLNFEKLRYLLLNELLCGLELLDSLLFG